MGKKKYLEINWKPNKNDKTSLTKQIVNHFRMKVSKGDWLSGDLLPPQREMAKLMEVNRSTIVSALNELTAQGLIESQVGKGTMIANGSWSFLFQNPTPDWKFYLENGIHKSNIPTIQTINKYEFIDDYIRLSTGEISPELMPHDEISEAFMEMAKLKIPYNYLEPLGLYELRVELCKYLKKYNLDIKPSEILIVSGSLQALQLISLSLLSGNSTVFVEEHSYIKSLNVFDFTNTKIQSVPMDKSGLMHWTIDESTLSKGNVILYTIPTFHNPTGLVMSKERREEIINWSQKRQLPIVEDDAYRELYFDEMPPLPLKSMDTSGNILYLGSVSKSMAPGLRIGWVVGPEPIIDRLGDIKMQTDYGASSVSQWMFTMLLKNDKYENHLISLREKLKKRSDHLLSLLDKYFSDLATWNKPEGGFYIWLKLNTKIPVQDIFDMALERNVLLNPGFIYGSKNNAYIRLSYSYANEKDLEEGLKILSDIIRGN